MIIKISDQILTGNLFKEDGYDIEESAIKLADLTKKAFREHFIDLYPNAKIEIDIDIQNATGCSRAVTINFLNDDDEYADDQHGGTSNEEWLANIAQKVYEDQMDEWAVEEENADE